MGVTLDVALEGPIFHDILGKVQAGVGHIIQAAIEAGEQHLDATLLAPRPKGVYLGVGSVGAGGKVCTNKTVSKGNYRRQVHGKPVSELHMLITDNGCVYGSWLEGESSRNSSTRFKGYRSFRKTRDWLEMHVATLVASAVQRLVRELG